MRHAGILLIGHVGIQGHRRKDVGAWNSDRRRYIEYESIFEEDESEGDHASLGGSSPAGRENGLYLHNCVTYNWLKKKWSIAVKDPRIGKRFAKAGFGSEKEAALHLDEWCRKNGFHPICYDADGNPKPRRSWGGSPGFPCRGSRSFLEYLAPPEPAGAAAAAVDAAEDDTEGDVEDEDE